MARRTRPVPRSAFTPTRKEARSGAQIHILYRLGGGDDEQVTSTLDISASGMQFRGPRPLPVNEPLTITLLLPGDLHPLELEGRIRWSAPDPVAPGLHNVGVSFEMKDAAGREALEAFVREVGPPGRARSRRPRA